MKIIKSNNKSQLVLNETEWRDMGKKAGWGQTDPNREKMSETLIDYLISVYNYIAKLDIPSNQKIMAHELIDYKFPKSLEHCIQKNLCSEHEVRKLRNTNFLMNLKLLNTYAKEYEPIKGFTKEDKQDILPLLRSYMLDLSNQSLLSQLIKRIKTVGKYISFN